MVSLCLNMIVRNEEKIITRCLDSVRSIVDFYLIVDTGSTDNTINIMKDYFEKNNLQAYIHQSTFYNFEHNRNEALKLCKGICDYILLLDADMVLKINNFNKDSLVKDCYNLIQKDVIYSYNNIRIIKNDLDFYYKGLTHEVMMIGTKSYDFLSEEDIYIEDVQDGGCKSSKIERDIYLLKEAIKKDPENDRNYFYLANTYFALGELKQAMEYYKKRIEFKGWNQELWYCFYKLGLIHFGLEEYEQGIINLLEAYNILPNRLENVYYIYLYYESTKRDNLKNLFLDIIKNTLTYSLKNENNLFVDHDLYSKMKLL